MRNRLVLLAACWVLASAAPSAAQTAEVQDLGHGIYRAAGLMGGTAVRVPQSNTFMIVTRDGNVIVDTSIAAAAPAHKRALSAANGGPIKAIILTHGHGDHTGGVALWKQPGTEIIAQRAHEDFIAYQLRLRGYFARSNAAQFGIGAGGGGAVGGAAVSPVPPTVLFEDRYSFELGGVRFDLLHTPGETPDHLTVWIPEFKAAFIGDNFYESFPNLYTLRGTETRKALDYVESLNTVMALDPELVLPSHGPVIRGRDEIRRQLTRYRDAILYVHDATVKGMNEGKSVLTLMKEITLPPALDVGESYGKLTWSIRGIYEGYVGWYDGNVSTMFGPPSQGYAEVVKLAGGPDAVAARARQLVESDAVQALYLTDMALAADGRHRAALEARLAALRWLDGHSGNSNERGWLAAGIRDAEKQAEAVSDYKAAGVDIDAGNETVRRIRALARGTFTPGVLSEIGSFGGLFRLDRERYKNPVLVSSADGVGTKLKVAFMTGKHDTVGADLVNHCVNDILVQGAEPLFFLDYLATGRLSPAVAEQIVSGVARACKENGCALIGGETAEMPGFYADGEYDIAGFIVGAVEESKVINGSAVVPGDVLIAVPSAGLHTNGYSLARRVFFDVAGWKADTFVAELGTTIADALLAPHRSYLSLVRPLIERDWVKGLAHITGGGLTENLPRTLPEGCAAEIDLKAWTIPPIFQLLQQHGAIAREEMFRAFNMGVGLVVVCPPRDAERVLNMLMRGGEPHAFRLGFVVSGERAVRYV